MKKALYIGLVLCVLVLFAVPAWAQKGSHRHGSGKSTTAHSHHQTTTSNARSNAGGKTRGIERAEQVQSMNTKADTNRGFTVAPGVEKAEKHSAGGKREQSKGTHQAQKGEGKKGGKS